MVKKIVVNGTYGEKVIVQIPEEDQERGPCPFCHEIGHILEKCHYNK